MKAKLLTALLCLTILISFTMTFTNVSKAATTPEVYVYDPITQGNISSAPIDQTFTIQVMVRDVENLVGFDFWLSWNDSLVSFVNLAEGPFLNSSGAYRSFFVPKYPGSSGWTYTDTIYAADSLLAPQLATSASGTGTLATVTFKVLNEGIGKFHLFNSILAKYDPFQPKAIPHTEADGYFALPLPKVIVEPAETINSGLEQGQSFSINITLINAINAYNWTLELKWGPSLLNATNIVEGSFLKDVGATDFQSTVNEADGTLLISNTFTGEPSDGVSGNGTLVKVTFSVLERGDTDIDISDVSIFKKDGTFVPAAVENGFFSNTTRDVALTSLTLSSNTVSKGQLLNITITVENHGVENETFNVKVDYDSHSIKTQAIQKLTPDTSQTIIITWDTTNVDPGTYTIKAEASRVTGEVNIADNTRTAGPVTVTGGGGIDFSNPLLIGGIVVVVLVVVAALGFFLFRRSKK